MKTILVMFNRTVFHIKIKSKMESKCQKGRCLMQYNNQRKKIIQEPREKIWNEKTEKRRKVFVTPQKSNNEEKIKRSTISGGAE